MIREMVDLFAKKQKWSIPASLLREIQLSGTGIIILAITGPLGSYERLTLVPRFIYWAVFVIFAGIIFRFFLRKAFASKQINHWWPIAKIALAASLGSVPAAVLIWVVDSAIIAAPLPLAHLPWFWLCAWLVGFPMGCFRQLVLQAKPEQRRGTIKNAGTDDLSANIAFMQKLPFQARGKILSISVQDHYIEVTTNNGRALVLMSLKDALNDLKDYRGMQIHRSHWIALDAATSLTRIGRKTFVNLSNGRQLPVSKTFEAGLKEVVG